MSLPVLYSFRRCPYAIRARIAMAKAGIEWEHREVSLKNKPDEMMRLSKKGTVPVLVFDNGTVIDESLDIMLWALDRHDPERWLQADMQATLDLIYSNDHDFKVRLDRYKYHVRYPEFTRQQYREQTEPFVAVLESQLQFHAGAGLVTTSGTLADVAIFPFVRQFANVDRDWFLNSGYLALVNWLNTWESSEDFLCIMRKYEYWQ